MPGTLAMWLAEATDIQLIDVREEWEYEVARLKGARLVPLGRFVFETATMDPSRDVVLYCHHGVRSLSAAQYLVQQGFSRVWNLVGGVDRYALEVDAALPRY
ncbi:MAG: rhodanese-like domain-containing protein [Gemmatimonadaceae bacterium]